MSGGKRGLHWALVALVAGLALLAVLLWTWWPDPPRVTRDQCRQWVEQKNLAIGYLESEKYGPADELFRELAERLPDELLPRRNLAVCRLLAFQAEQIDAPRVRQAIDRLLLLQPDSATAHWLDAQLLLAVKDRLPDPDEREQKLGEAVERLVHAARLDPDRAPIRYELFEAARYSAEEPRRALAQEALQQAYRLAPHNLFVMTEWLVVQAERRDADVVQTLAAAKQQVQPLREGIRRRAKADVIELLDQALEAVQQENWPLVLARARQVGSVVRPEEAAQSDRAQIAPHPLEHIRHQFSAEFCGAYRPLQPEPPPAIPVRLVRWPDDQQPPAARDIRDVHLADFNLDGRLDLIVLRPEMVEVYGRPDGRSAWQVLASLPLPPAMQGILAADLDRDALVASGATQPAAAAQGPNQDGQQQPLPGPEPQATEPGDRSSGVCHQADVDLVLYGPGGVLILRNDRDPQTGRRSLVPVEQDDAFQAMDRVLAAVLVDFDHDGDLDLVLATEQGIELWLNRGDMTFENFTAWSELPPPEFRFTTLVAVDWDRDGDLDVVLAGPDAAGYLENLRHGQFRWRPFEDDDFAPLQGARRLALLEADGNVSWDLAAAGEDGLGVVLTTTPQPGVVRPLHATRLAAEPQRGVVAWDFDNDGFQDLLAWGAEGIEVFRGGAEGTFQRVPEIFDPPPQATGTCDVGDLDGDGDLDLVVATDQGLVLYRNEGGNANPWLSLQVKGLEDSVSGRVNHQGLGSLLEMKAGLMYQAQVVGGQFTHFGLGQQRRADVVRVLMTNGIPQAVIQPQPNQVLCEEMALKGSCPYVYTWNGERYEFFTDLLWAAPLGLQLADGQLAPSRPWEYLKIPGEKLQLKEGRYCLRVTEELWEAAYFDQIQLIAVDHPADVEIHSNEKVGPAEIASFHVHTVRDPRPPVAARDSQGRDVLERILAQDGDYVKPFARQLRQGLTEEHFLELDLGPLDNPQQITLFLTGWIYPTDTSLNIALSQDPRLAPPRPPAISVPDAQRRWQEVIPFMGFPGGKTKTIAVDLSDAFLTDDYRLRITTTAQLYWDHIFFSVDEPPAALRQNRLTLESAHLHYRGFSRPLPGYNNAPERYDYDDVSAEMKWPPMRGNFTRYGDVRPLLAEANDLLVVMGAGDELALEFLPPEEDPPPGWKRDFLMYNVGWDKDADLNTVYGQTVEPLPFRDMPSYPYGPAQSYPDTPRHREYQKTYQTRQQSPARFWRQLAPPAARNP